MIFALALVLTTIPQPTAKDAQLLSGIVASAAAQDARYDVLTAEDVRTAVDFEASKQLVGCSESSSCLVEIANAMDARFVVSGTLGALGDVLVLQLNVLDVKGARSVGRQSLRAADTNALAATAEAMIQTTLAGALAGAPAAEPAAKVRLVILDFQLAVDTAAVAQPAPVAPVGSRVLPLAGGVLLGVGVLTVGAGVLFDLDSVSRFNAATADASLSAVAASEAYAASDGAGTLAAGAYVVGGVAVVVGGGLLAWGLLE